MEGGPGRLPFPQPPRRSSRPASLWPPAAGGRRPASLAVAITARSAGPSSGSREEISAHGTASPPTSGQLPPGCGGLQLPLSLQDGPLKVKQSH